MSDKESPQRATAQVPAQAPADDKASFTELIPVVSHKIHLFRNKFVIPGLLIALTSVAFLMWPLTTDNIQFFIWLLADYFMFTLFCVIYFYVEIDRPLSLYAIPAVTIFIIMQVPLILYPAHCATGVCGHQDSVWYGIYYAFDFLWQGLFVKVVGSGSAAWQNVLAMVAQPGLREEFVKAIPALIGAGLTLAEVPAIYALAILVPPIGLLVNGQRVAAIVNLALLALCLLIAVPFKAYPLLLLIPAEAIFEVWLHRRHQHPDAKPSKLLELLRVRDPLDGVMIGVAAGLTFTLLENMSQYIPDQGTFIKQQGGSFDSQILGELLLLIPRSLDSILAHFAWAGISGYFIGLVVLRPQGWPVMLAIGWLVPALLHGTFDGLLASHLDWWTLPLDLLSFVLFLACLLKARQLHMSLFEDGATAARE